MHLPDDLWRAVQALAPEEGDANTVILRALEEYVTATRKRPGRPQPGKYQKLVTALSTPVADLHLSARPASALKILNIQYVYELVQKSPLDLFGLPNFGAKSLREVKAKLANLGLTLGMTVEEDAYRAAVVAAVVASIKAAEK
jgi:DNA-directed RNA polymerase alpha subunit